MRVLLATDGSNDAKAAVEWLHHLPLPGDRDVMVITVVMPPLIPVVPDLVGELHGALIADARRLADDTASELLCRTAIGRVVEGDPREEIVAAAREWGADLIVLGARGLGAIKEFLLGSVSLWVARHAPCPVLVCKGTPRTVRTITVGLDGSVRQPDDRDFGNRGFSRRRAGRQNRRQGGQGNTCHAHERNDSAARAKSIVARRWTSVISIEHRCLRRSSSSTVAHPASSTRCFNSSQRRLCFGEGRSIATTAQPWRRSSKPSHPIPTGFHSPQSVTASSTEGRAITSRPS